MRLSSAQLDTGWDMLSKLRETARVRSERPGPGSGKPCEVTEGH